eukprot:11895326-Alexandrium_andersonii.AAC.1
MASPGPAPVKWAGMSSAAPRDLHVRGEGAWTCAPHAVMPGADAGAPSAASRGSRARREGAYATCFWKEYI